MTNEPAPAQADLSVDSPTRREWVKPIVHNMVAGGAENAPGDTRTDGSGTFS